MKRLTVRMTFLLICLIVSQTTIKAQADYTFTNSVKVSGPALQTGTKYRFSNVKSGVDAIVTINAQTDGITLTDIDNSSTGFNEAFQPFVNFPAKSNGYVEFQLDFVIAGTSTPMVQNLVPVTCIDMDGVTYSDGSSYKQDQVQFFPGYYEYSMTGGSVQATMLGGWLLIKNTSGLSYSGIDTSIKTAMATVVNKSISSFLLRIGSSNTSSTKSAEQRSVYFKTFYYGRPLSLPNRTMLSMSGTKKPNGVELNGILSSSHSYDRMIFERTSSSASFSYIGEMDISGTASSTFPFTFLDTRPENGVNYYRIRLVSTKTNIQEITNILMIKNDNVQKNLEVINTILQGSNPVLSIRSLEDKEADLQLTDMSGQIVTTIKRRLNSGSNNINLSGFNSTKGYFVLLVRTNNNSVSQKIMIQ